MKRALLIGIGVVLVAAVLFVFVIPYLQPRCQQWYHSVDFVTDKLFEDRFDRRPTRNDYEKRADLIEELRAEAIEDIGAKPLYCT